MTFLVPSSAACAMGSSSGAQGVVTMRGLPSSVSPTAPGIIYPTESIRRTCSVVFPSGLMRAASFGTNFGSAVKIVRPEPDCGSSSVARSRS